METRTVPGLLSAIAAAAVASAVSLSQTSCAHPAAAAPPAARLPSDARLRDPGGASFAPARRYRGRVVLLDFWASWCEECKRSVPRVDRVASAFAADGLVVVGVNAGDGEGVARSAAAALGIRYPIALDPELEFADRLGATGLPLLLVLDRDGRVLHRARAVDAETLAAIRRALAGPPGAARPAASR